MGRSAKPDPVSLMRSVRVGLQEKLEELADSVDQTAADRGFQALLLGMSKLWRYGLLNSVMIQNQRPDATAVAGRRQWESLGRTVREGEAPIDILAPKRQMRGGFPFIFVEVFDIAQTDGPPIPPRSSLVNPKGDCRQLSSLEKASRLLDIKLHYVDEFPTFWGDDKQILGRALRSRRVLVRSTLTELERARVLVHEYAHVLLHQHEYWQKRYGWPSSGHLPHAVREAEADATAFVVLEALGLPSNIPTYIVWMGARGKTILSSMRRIKAAARAILTATEGDKPNLRIPRLPRNAEPGPRALAGGKAGLGGGRHGSPTARKGPRVRIKKTTRGASGLAGARRRKARQKSRAT